MLKVYSAKQLRAMDSYCEQKLDIATLTLMRKAAIALAKTCAEVLRGGGKILFLCGKGNNGGDGFAAARVLKELHYDVTVVLTQGKQFSPDASVMFRSLGDIPVVEDLWAAERMAKNFDLIVDCVIGTGFSGTLDSELISLFDSVREKRIVACDVPSGVFPDDGRVAKGTLKAERTVTFAGMKPCFYLEPSAAYCGTVVLSDLDMPQEVFEQSASVSLMDSERDLQNLLKVRPQRSHKGTFGTLTMICGSLRMPGAACLAAQGALRTGVGLLRIVGLPSTLRLLKQKLSEPVWDPVWSKKKTDAVLVGCGSGKFAWLYLMLAFFYKKPLVIDADGLNALARHLDRLDDFLKKNPKLPVILTPHPAEFARLTGTRTDAVEKDRINAALEFVKKHGVTLVLKGHYTLVVSPNGTYLNRTGNSGLAKGGSGDTLAGMISSFLAQGYPSYDAAVLGVALHGLCAEELCKTYGQAGILPSDLPLAAARLLKPLQDEKPTV